MFPKIGTKEMQGNNETKMRQHTKEINVRNMRKIDHRKDSKTKLEIMGNN